MSGNALSNSLVVCRYQNLLFSKVENIDIGNKSKLVLKKHVFSDGFTHRPNRSWPKAPRFWSPAQLLLMTTD